MPIHFKATKNGEYTLDFNFDGVELDYLHLIDNMTGADIDLLDTPAYTFQAKINDYTSRFRLVFSANNSNIDNGSNDFAFISNGNLVVNGEGTLQVVDMLGHILVCREVHSDSQLLSFDFLTSGVYVLRLIDGENVRTQKIVID